MAERSKRMTDQEARYVRVLRVDLGCSWDRVAELFSRVFPWTMPSLTNTQEGGAKLCELAAMTLGEDPAEEPWN